MSSINLYLRQYNIADRPFFKVLTVEPYLHKPSTLKRGQAWTQVADILSSVLCISCNSMSCPRQIQFFGKTVTSSA